VAFAPRSADGDRRAAGRRLTSALPSRFRHDGLFWREVVYYGATLGPDWAKRRLPPLFAGMLFALLRDKRRGLAANLRRVLGARGPLADASAGMRTFAEFAHCLVETMDFTSSASKHLEVEAPREIHDTEFFPTGRGVVVLTSHFGNWEIAAHLLQRYGRKINVVMASEANPSVEVFQSRMREGWRMRIIRSDTSPFAALEMLHALRRGEVVAIQLDRAAPGQVTRTIDFFGEPAPFQYGPFALARLSGASLWPVFAPRLGPRHYRILPEPVRTIARDASEQQSLAVMTDVVRSFERHVRAHPHQWFQFKPFWDNC